LVTEFLRERIVPVDQFHPLIDTLGDNEFPQKRMHSLIPNSFLDQISVKYLFMGLKIKMGENKIVNILESCQAVDIYPLTNPSHTGNML
jgi:hypothetical protein